MSKPDSDKPASDQGAISEVIPGRVDQVSGMGSLGAPFIYSDWIGSHGHTQGAVATFTLEATRHMTVGAKSVRDRVVVGHLRMPLHTMRALKEAIEEVELLLAPAAEGSPN